MTRRRPKTPLAGSLRLKLATWLLSPLLLLLAFDAYLTHQRAKAASNVAFDRVLLASAKQIQEGVRIRDGHIEVDIPYLTFELFEASNVGRLFYRVSEEGGSTLTGYHDLPLPSSYPGQFFKPIFYDAQYQHEDIRAVAFRMPVYDITGNPVRTVWIVMAETPDTRAEIAKELLVGSVLQEVVLVLLALGIFVLAGKAVIRPIERLSQAVASREESRRDSPIPGDMPAELRPLLEALTAYTTRMQDMISARRRFIDDAAHQLKTPLAVMQAQLELAMRASTPAEAQAHVGQALGTLASSADGVVKLLSLARLEPDNGRVYTLRPCDLTAIARQVALDMSPLARSKDIDLGFETQGAVVIQGESSLLQELTANLLDNAIRHAGSGTVITVRVETQPRPRLQVIDNGPGVPEASRELVLKRFYRLPGSAEGGSGLGLSIVREIARVHAADLSLDDAPGGGLAVSVSFPTPRELEMVSSASA